MGPGLKKPYASKHYIASPWGVDYGVTALYSRVPGGGFLNFHSQSVSIFK